jgi:hypothetical protein
MWPPNYHASVMSPLDLSLSSFTPKGLKRSTVSSNYRFENGYDKDTMSLWINIKLDIRNNNYRFSVLFSISAIIWIGGERKIATQQQQRERSSQLANPKSLISSVMASPFVGSRRFCMVHNLISIVKNNTCSDDTGWIKQPSKINIYTHFTYVICYFDQTKYKHE